MRTRLRDGGVKCDSARSIGKWVHVGDRSERGVVVIVEHELDHVHQVPTESGRHRCVVVAWDVAVVGGGTMGRGSAAVQGVGGGPSWERRLRAVVRERARAA